MPDTARLNVEKSKARNAIAGSVKKTPRNRYSPFSVNHLHGVNAMTEQRDKSNCSGEAMHDRQVRAVMTAIAKLTTKAAPQQCSAAAVFEGAVRGGALAVLAHSDATAADIAELLENFAAAFRDLAPPNFHVVQ